MLNTSSLDIAVAGRLLVRALELAVGAGQCWAVLGPNGGGKTLLLHTLAGLRRPDRGAVHLDGAPFADWGRRAVAQRLALLLQEEAPDYWGTVREYVALGRLPFGRRDSGDPVVAETIGRLGLVARADQTLRSLSGGERQRARLAQTIAQDTAVLLWDEPLNHLDLRHQGDIMRIARALCEQGKAVVLTVHEPAWALAYCSHALLLYDSGRTASGPARSIINDRAISELYSLEQPTPALSASGMHASDTPTGHFSPR